MSKLITIGLCGKAGAGKDSVADYLVEEHDFSKVSFAYALKQGVKAMFALPDELVNDRSRRDEPLEGMPDWTVRKLWQFVGTDLMRNQVDKDIWIKTLARCVRQHRQASVEHIVISDVRFPNEVACLHDIAGDGIACLIEVKRPGHVGHDVGLKNHESETHVLQLDLSIENDGTMLELNDKVDEVLSTLMRD